MPAARARLLDLFLERLYAGGLLFLGRGESPGPRGGPLRLVLYPGGAVYRKPLRP
jgi:chemotaxis methyl-accepting protein methylase